MNDRVRLWCLRHAESQNVTTGIAGAVPTAPLTARGHHQAIDAASALAAEPITSIYSSTALLARQTAKHLAAPPGLDRAAQGVVGVYDHAEAAPGQFGGGHVVVGGRHHDDGKLPAVPFPEGEHLLRALLLGMDQKSVGARALVHLGPVEGLVQATTRDQRLDPRHDHQLAAATALHGGADLGREIRGRDELVVALQEAVQFGKQLVFDAHTRHAAGLVGADHVGDVVRVAESRVAVREDRYGDRAGHRGGRLEAFRHGQDIRVRDACRRGYLQSARPDEIETGFLGDPGAQRAVATGGAKQLTAS